jgi:cytochrome c5
MRCVKNGSDVACTVTNYGNNTTDDQADADAALAGTAPVATVAMEYAPIEDDLLGDPVVKFFVYDGAGQRINAANLDGKGLRPIPQLCMVCHGGEFTTGPTTGVPIFGGPEDAKLNSVFLPFDLAYYTFPSSAGWDKASQQASFKSLNEDIVLATNTTTAIQEVITQMYAGGPTQDEDFTVAGWAGSAAQSAMYEDVVAHTCRTCHAALPASDLQFDTASEFIDRLGAVETRVCQQHVMPHSLITHNLFWQSINPNMVAHLQSFGDTYATPVNGWAGNKCGVFTAGGTTPPSQFLTNVHPIFDSNNCTSCHVGTSPPAGLNLSAALAYGQIVNTASTQLPSMDRIEPSNVAQSYLLHKIKGTQGSVGGLGGKMPPGGSVPAGDITAIETWVNAGAPP